MTPPLPTPDGTLRADASSPALADLPTPTADRAKRCSAWLVEEIVPEEQQSAWEVSSEGHRAIASGLLLGEHQFNTIVGVLAGDLFVETWSGMLDRRNGVVRIPIAGGAPSEVAPLSVDGHVRHSLSYAGALWVAQRGKLLRLTAAGVTVVAEDLEENARLVRTTGGLAVVAGDFVRLLRGTSLTPRAQAATVRGEAFDVHPDGTVVYARDRALYRSDRVEPILRASDPIASVRVDASSGAIVFSLFPPSPALSALFVLDGRGVRHVLTNRRALPQDQERPFQVLRSEAGKALVATTCADDADLPSRMPIYVDLSTGAATYVVDEAAWPYVPEYAVLLETGLERRDFGWVDAVHDRPRFYVRR